MKLIIKVYELDNNTSRFLGVNDNDSDLVTLFHTKTHSAEPYWFFREEVGIFDTDSDIPKEWLDNYVYRSSGENKIMLLARFWTRGYAYDIDRIDELSQVLMNIDLACSGITAYHYDFATGEDELDIVMNIEFNI